MNPAKIINDILVKNNGVKNMPKSIRLGNLPRDLPEIETELRKVFNEIGPVRDVYVPKKLGVPIGYGFIEFLDAADAVHAVAYFCRGLKIGDTKARVELAEGKRRQPAEMVFRDMSPAARVFVRAKLLVDNCTLSTNIDTMPQAIVCGME
jgi:RNA recognition motif-containing protein